MMSHQQNLLVLTFCEFMNLYLGLLVISVLLVTFTRRRNNSSTRNNVASRKKAYHGRYVMGGVGTSAPCSVMERKQPYAFRSCRVGVPLRSLATEHLSKKQDDSSVFIKPTCNRNLPCALHCPRKFRRARGVQVAPDTVAVSCAYSWNPFSLPAHCPALPCPLLPCPCLLLLQQPGPLCGLWLGVALSLTYCCVSSAEPAGPTVVCTSGPQAWWHRGIPGDI